jgi:hypothetical protein
VTAAETTLRGCAKAIVSRSNGTLMEEDILKILEPFKQEMLNGIGETVAPLIKHLRGEGDWSFTLPGGMVAKVTFSGEPERRHIEAFAKVFNAMIAAWLETEA